MDPRAEGGVVPDGEVDVGEERPCGDAVRRAAHVFRVAGVGSEDARLHDCLFRVQNPEFGVRVWWVGFRG